MRKAVHFPIVTNRSTIPPGFQVLSLHCGNEAFSVLRTLGCTSLVAVDSPAGWCIERGGKLEYDHLDVFFPVTGSICLLGEEVEYCVRPGQMLIIPSWYDRQVYIDTACYHIYVSFDNPEDYPWLTKVAVRNSLNTDVIASFSRMLILDHSVLPDEVSFRRHLAECLAILLSRELQPTVPQASSARSRELLKLLQENGPHDWSVSAVARKFGMSLTSLRTFCLANFGQSPGDLLNEIRMSRARAMLTYSDCTIEEIASQLGYRDRFIFSKAFTRLNHQPPVAYRRSCRGSYS